MNALWLIPAFACLAAVVWLLMEVIFQSEGDLGRRYPWSTRWEKAPSTTNRPKFLELTSPGSTMVLRAPIHVCRLDPREDQVIVTVSMDVEQANELAGQIERLW